VDSLRNGDSRQAELLEWKVKATFEEGLCGVIIFKWTDLWWRGGNIIQDWKFGIVDEERKPKEAYRAVSSIFSKSIYSLLSTRPLISIVVAVYNGERFLGECLESLMDLRYQNKEIIVVDDGSKDSTPLIAQKYPVKLIRNEENLGLSQARNAGIKAAKGVIVAFTDADCRADLDWLFYIAHGFKKEDVGAVGGPNLTPPEDDFLAHRVGEALGGPKCVLIGDKEAEHIPGCNMAYRREVLEKIGGFDPVFTRAGDDVDMCWRVREMGYNILREPSAVVWHHRRGSVKAYFKQQFGYGVAESLLGKKHPDKYSHRGLKWSGRVYGANPVISFSRPRIYYAPFPYVYMPIYGVLSYLPLTFDWYILTAITLLLTPFSIWFIIVSSILFSTSIASCILLGLRMSKKRYKRRWNKIRSVTTVSILNLIWPIARGLGRIFGQRGS